MAADRFKALLIDDELPMLKALARAIPRLQPDWDIFTAQNAVQAIDLMQKHQPHLVLSDYRMPDMQGDALLLEAQKYCPLALRTLLTGDSSEQVIITGYSAVHRYLAKPFSDQQLLAELECVKHLSELPFNVDCRHQLGKLCSLPMLPRIYKELQQKMQAEDSDAKLIAKLIEQEPVLSAKIMQIANSAFLGFPRPTTSLPEAVNRLGSKLIQTICLATYSHGQLQQQLQPHEHQLLVQQGYQHAQLTRQLARLLQFSREQQDSLYMAALLSSLGKLIIASLGCPLRQVQSRDELQTGYCDFGVITAYLLTLWGFPKEFGYILMMQGKWRDDTKYNRASNILFVAAQVLYEKQLPFLQHQPDVTLCNQPLSSLLEQLAAMH